jgi:hypothetical protein
MDVMSFSLLVDMLEPKLSVNERMPGMASLSMNRSKSKPITHGLSKAAVYKNLMQFVDAINETPELDIN